MKKYCCGLSREIHDLCKKTFKILQAEYFQKEIFFNYWELYSIWTRENILLWNAGEISMYWAAGKHYRSNENLLNWIFHGGWWLLLITVHVKLPLLTPDDLAYIFTLDYMKGLSSGINSSWKEAPSIRYIFLVKYFLLFLAGSFSYNEMDWKAYLIVISCRDVWVLFFSFIRWHNDVYLKINAFENFIFTDISDEIQLNHWARSHPK